MDRPQGLLGARAIVEQHQTPHHIKARVVARAVAKQRQACCQYYFWILVWVFALVLVYGWWGGWGGMGRGQANHEPSDPILKYKIRSIAFGDLGASNQGDSL